MHPALQHVSRVRSVTVPEGAAVSPEDESLYSPFHHDIHGHPFRFSSAHISRTWRRAGEKRWKYGRLDADKARLHVGKFLVRFSVFEARSVFLMSSERSDL
jgi:hypothetical protein